MHAKTDAKDQEILRLVRNAFVSVDEIAARLFMSPSTVRRRLSALERDGYVIRTHGGAMLNKNRPSDKNLPLYLRTMQFDEGKKKIAVKAASLVSDGDILFIDSSSTVLFMLPYLTTFENLTVCTNSLKAATVLAELEISCVLFGGDVRPGEMACNSEETAEMIDRIRADLFFFSCDALSADGTLSDNSKSNVYLRRRYRRNAKKAVLLIDETKFGKTCPYRLGELRGVNYCVSDRPLDERLMQTAKDTIFK